MTSKKQVKLYNSGTKLTVHNKEFFYVSLYQKKLSKHFAVPA